MIQELLYTSVPQGLRPGSRGFCTVLCTQGMPAPIIEALERLSGYKHLYMPGDPQADRNPVCWSHLHTTIGGRRVSVLSRIADSGLDYTQRTNKIAHHVMLNPADRIPAGPARLLLHPGFLSTQFEGQPRVVPPRVVPAVNDLAAAPCRAWEAATGDAGWAGVLVESFLNDPSRLVYLTFTPGFDPLPLIAEALDLLPPEQRWEVTFSTYFTTLPGSAACLWRCLVADSTEANESRRQVQALRLTLGEPLPPPAPSPWVEFARSGVKPAALTPRRPSPKSSDSPVPPPPTTETYRLLPPSAPPTTPPPLSPPRRTRIQGIVWGVVAAVLLLSTIGVASLTLPQGSQPLLTPAALSSLKKHVDALLHQGSELSQGTTAATSPSIMAALSPSDPPTASTGPAVAGLDESASLPNRRQGLLVHVLPEQVAGLDESASLPNSPNDPKTDAETQGSTAPPQTASASPAPPQGSDSSEAPRKTDPSAADHPPAAPDPPPETVSPPSSQPTSPPQPSPKETPDARDRGALRTAVLFLPLEAGATDGLESGDRLQHVVPLPDIHDTEKLRLSFWTPPEYSAVVAFQLEPAGEHYVLKVQERGTLNPSYAVIAKLHLLPPGEISAARLQLEWNQPYVSPHRAALQWCALGIDSPEGPFTLLVLRQPLAVQNPTYDQVAAWTIPSCALDDLYKDHEPSAQVTALALSHNGKQLPFTIEKTECQIRFKAKGGIPRVTAATDPKAVFPEMGLNWDSLEKKPRPSMTVDLTGTGRSTLAVKKKTDAVSTVEQQLRQSFVNRLSAASASVNVEKKKIESIAAQLLNRQTNKKNLEENLQEVLNLIRIHSPQHKDKQELQAAWKNSVTELKKQSRAFLEACEHWEASTLFELRVQLPLQEVAARRRGRLDLVYYRNGQEQPPEFEFVAESPSHE